MRIRATRIHTNIAIAVSKLRKHIHHRHRNNKSPVRQWSNVDVRNVQLHENYFDKVICTVCPLRGFLFADICFMSISGSNVCCSNHLCTTAKATCNHSSHRLVLSVHFSAQELDDQMTKRKLLLEDLVFAKASSSTETPRLRRNRKGRTATVTRNHRKQMVRMAKC